VTAPWWLWNALAFGSLLQVSGQALLWQWHGADWLQPANYLAGTLNAARRFGLRVALHLVQVWPPVALAGLTLISSASAQGKRRMAPLADLFAPLTYVALLLGWYVLYFWHVQNWYLMPVMLVGALGVGYAYPALVERVRGWRLPALAATVGYLALSGVAIFAVVWMTRGFGYPRQVGGLRLAEWANANVQAGQSIGVWNAGIVGYYSDHRVVNLDGVVNNDLYSWVRQRGMALQPTNVIAYARERGIVYVTDYEDILRPALATAEGQWLREKERLAGTDIAIYALPEPK
jgi:hypothetical protein